MHRCKSSSRLIARALKQRSGSLPACHDRKELLVSALFLRQSIGGQATCLASGFQPSRQHSTSTVLAAAARLDADSIAEAAAAAAAHSDEEDEDVGAEEASSEDNEGVSDDEMGTPLAHLPPGASIQQTAEMEGQPAITFQTGRFARLANGSCVVQQGDTQVLAAVACNASERAHLRREDVIPLQVDFRERLYASGRVPTTWNRQEGQPKDQELLASRAVDRALRPLFPNGFQFDTRMTVNVLSGDKQHDAEVLAINAASAALAVSPIPWDGPIGAVRVAVSKGQATINPTGSSSSDEEAPTLSMLIAGTRDHIIMLEAEGTGATAEDFSAALAAAEPAVGALIAAQEQLAAAAQVTKRNVVSTGPDPAGVRTVANFGRDLVRAAVRETEGGKAGRAGRVHAAKQEVTDKIRRIGAFRFEGNRMRGSSCASPQDIDAGVSALVKEAVHELAFADDARVDGRGLLDLRPLHCEVGSVPVVHGIALFQRGETQSLATATLTKSESEDSRAPNLVVHYTSPAFANNEVPRSGFGGLNRREVGHSELIRRALQPSLPRPSQDYPWLIRLNADTLAANGSSSMAAVCAGSLALVDAGVLLPGGLTAGVSVGQFTQRPRVGEEAADAPASAQPAPAGTPSGWFGGGGGGSARCELLLDLQGLEDALGDMDLKVAATRHGITAAQLDVKGAGVTAETVLRGLQEARTGLAAILDTMEAAAEAVVASGDARFGSMQIDPAMIGRVIGTAGSTIRALEEQTGARFAVSDSGCIEIYAPAGFAAAEAAVQSAIGGNIKVGEVYRARVQRLMDYGAFVELVGEGNTRGLVHISEVAAYRVQRVEDELSVGMDLEVMCIGRDARGNIKLSRKAVLSGNAG